MSTHSTQVLEGLLRESRLCGATPLDEVVKMSWFFDEIKLGQVFRMRGQRLSSESHRGGPAFGMNQFRSPTHEPTHIDSLRLVLPVADQHTYDSHSLPTHAMNQFRSHSLPTHLMKIFRLSMRMETFRFPMEALVGCADEAHVALLRRASKRM